MRSLRSVLAQVLQRDTVAAGDERRDDVLGIGRIRVPRRLDDRTNLFVGNLGDSLGSPAFVGVRGVFEAEVGVEGAPAVGVEVVAS